MRALLYARKSTYRQRRGAAQQGRSVNEQLTEERAWCADNGAVVVDEYVDDDRSASRFATKEREDFERLVADIEAGKGHIVVAWESSRLQRDLAIYVRLRDACWKAGVLWCYNGRVYDLSNRDDRRMTAYDAIRDEDESEAISDRVERAMRANARAGRPHGRPLYGYRREYDGTGKLAKVVIDRVPCAAFRPACVVSRAFVTVEIYKRADIVQEIVDRLAAGQSLSSLVARLNGRGIRPTRGAKWSITTIRQMATNPAYIGKRHYLGELIGDAIWPPILDEATFFTVTDLLGDVRRRSYRDGAVKHLLSGIAQCQVCEDPAFTNKHARGYRGYVCKDGRHFFTKMDPVDDYIEDLLVRRLASPDAAELFAIDRDDQTLRMAKDQVARWRRDLAEAEELVEADKLTVTSWASLERRLLPKIEAAEKQLRRSRMNPLLASLIRPTVEEVWEEWRRLEIAQKRAAIRAAFDWIRIAPKGAGRRNVDATEFVTFEWATPA